MITPKFLKTYGLLAAVAFVSACASNTDTALPEEQEVVETEVFEEAETVTIDTVTAEERARQEAEAREAAAQEQIRTLDKVVYFAFDKSTLSSATKSLLNAHAAVLAESNVVARIEGHADELGTREYNMALGERRAKAVMNYLASLGVPRSRMETISYGEEKPAVLGSGSSVRAKNRRVEIVYN